MCRPAIKGINFVLDRVSTDGEIFSNLCRSMNRFLQAALTFSEDTLAVTLGCGCCLIVSLLTTTIILWQLRNNRKKSVRATPVSFNESIAALQCFVAATVVAIQALILFAALDTTVRRTSVVLSDVQEF